MTPTVDLAPGAEDNALALDLVQMIRAGLERPRGAADFRALRGAIHLVAQDTGEALTLRFDHGRLSVHDGSVGVPAVTFCGDRTDLTGLSAIELGRRLGFPVLGLLDRARGEPLRRAVRQVTQGKLRIYGLFAHPRTVFFLVRLLARPSATALD